MGANCSLRSCPGAGDCSLHGFCDTSRGVCECFRGYDGDTCAVSVCTPVLAPPLVGVLSTAHAVAASTLTACGHARAGNMSCCESAQDATAAAVLRSVASVPGICLDAWETITCPSFCAPTQGQWMTWSSNAHVVPAPVLVPANASASAAVTALACAGRCCEFDNTTCCAAVQQSIAAVSDELCAEHLLLFLYAVHCDAGAGPSIICSNYSRSLYDACADASGLGLDVRQTFGHSDNFADAIVPQHLSGRIATGSSGCIAPPLPADNSTTELKPWEGATPEHARFSDHHERRL